MSSISPTSSGDSSQTGPPSLSTGSIVGIAVGSTAFALLCASLGAVLLIRRKKRRRRPGLQPSPSDINACPAAAGDYQKTSNHTRIPEMDAPGPRHANAEYTSLAHAARELSPALPPPELDGAPHMAELG